MATLVFIGAMGFSALLDMAMAVAITYAITSFFGLSLSWHHYFVVAPFIGIFPDFDALFQLSSSGKTDDAHHTILHRPLLMAAIGFLGGAFFFGYPWGFIMMLSWLAHHFHDSCCLDFGLKWLWPFSNNSFHFGGRQSLGKKESARFRLVHAYTPEELEQLKSQFIDVQTWLKLIYYQPTVYSITELLIAATLLFCVLIFSPYPEVATPVWSVIVGVGTAFLIFAKRFA